MLRFYCPVPLNPGDLLSLPACAVRHVQVLRLQPGQRVTLFNGMAGEFAATITDMGRSRVDVKVGAYTPVERSARCPAHLAVGMPAHDRMDWLVEKATELGVASVQPLMTRRSVLKLGGDRAVKKQAHWQAIAASACEQCGGNLMPQVHGAMMLTDWLSDHPPTHHEGMRLLLSWRAGAVPLPLVLASVAQSEVSSHRGYHVLCGPEGGLCAEEEEMAIASGYQPVTLGPRVLRTETAALSALAVLLV